MMRFHVLAACVIAWTVMNPSVAQCESPFDQVRTLYGLDGKPIGSLPETPKNSDTPPIAPHERAALSADVAELVAGSNRFALSIYQRLAAGAEPGENVLVSPFSISSALAMTYAGARGETAQQMADVLRFTLPDGRLHSAFGELMRDLSVDREGYQLSIANRVFGQDGFPFKQPFLQTIDRDYGAPLEALNFRADPDASRERVNQWVEERTNDRIKNLMPEGSVNEDTRLVLANAIYFDGSWKSKFDANLTRKDTFFGADGAPAQVDTMFQNQTFGYTERPGFQMLEMPYAGNDLSMVVMLPTERDGLANLEASLTAESLQLGLKELSNTPVNVYLPKFTFNSGFKLGAALDKMGITDAFDPEHADFSGIVDPKIAQLYIQTAVHKAFIDVNEEGTEAAAATSIGIGVTTCLCPLPQPKIFRADHPFLFALRDRHSGSLLFLGRVMTPGEWTANVTLTPAVAEPASAVSLVVASICLAGRRSRGRVHEIST